MPAKTLQHTPPFTDLCDPYRRHQIMEDRRRRDAETIRHRHHVSPWKLRILWNLADNEEIPLHIQFPGLDSGD